MQEIASVFAKTGTITQAQRSVACHWKARDYYKLFEIVPSKSEWTTCQRNGPSRTDPNLCCTALAQSFMYNRVGSTLGARDRLRLAGVSASVARSRHAVIGPPSANGRMGGLTQLWRCIETVAL